MTSLFPTMLDESIIQSNTSSFSSLVILIRKKKDDTWRFRVNYRALNSITIKDNFPILTIEELLANYNSCFHKMF